MQIVIEIDDMTYKFAQNTAFVEDESTLFKQTNADRQKTLFLFNILDAIKNSIPLPKGHGRLIDADELYKQDKEEWLCPNNAPFISTDYAHVFAEIDHAPTIIEADKAVNIDE